MISPNEKFGFVNVVGACEILGVSKSWLYKATSRCLIPHYKLGNKLMFKIEELQKYFEANCNKII